MPVLLLNPNTNSATTQAMVHLARQACRDLTINGRTAPFGAPMIVDETGLAIGAQSVMAMLDTALLRGEPIDGVIVAAFGDPGLAAIRAKLDRPVCGIGEASFLEAAQGGRRFAVATTTPELAGAIGLNIDKAGLSEQFAGVFLTREDPYELVAEPPRLLAALKQAARKALDAGAEAVIIGGGPLAIVAQKLRAAFNAPIIDPVSAAARRIAKLIGKQKY